MAFDEALTARVRELLGPRRNLTEREMFGGFAFMVNGNMAVGVTGDELMVRVGKEAHEEAVTRPGAKTSVMGTKPMIGWIKVDEQGIQSDEGLAEWVAWGVSHAESLPPK